MKIAIQLAAHLLQFQNTSDRKKIIKASKGKCKEPPNFSLVTLDSEDSESMFSKF